jgi:hypothetical protein
MSESKLCPEGECKESQWQSLYGECVGLWSLVVSNVWGTLSSNQDTCFAGNKDLVPTPLSGPA